MPASFSLPAGCPAEFRKVRFLEWVNEFIFPSEGYKRPEAAFPVTGTARGL